MYLNQRHGYGGGYGGQRQNRDAAAAAVVASMTQVRIHTISEYPSDLLHLVMSHRIKFLLLAVGLLVYTFGQGVPTTPAEQAAFHREMPNDAELGSLVELEHAAREAALDYRASTTWFGWSCEGACLTLRSKSERATAAAAAAQAVVNFKLAAAKQQLSLFSDDAVSELRDQWSQTWGAGKRTSASMSKSSAQMIALRSIFSRRADDDLMSLLMEWVLQSVFWFVTTAVCCLVAFAWTAWSLCWSYKGSVVAVLAVWLLSTLAVTAYMAALFGSIVLAGNVALRAIAGRAPALTDGESGGRRDQSAPQHLRED